MVYTIKLTKNFILKISNITWSCNGQHVTFKFIRWNYVSYVDAV